MEKREEGAIAAPVIKQALTLETPRQSQPRLEAASMAPGDQAVFAENLLGGVVAVAQRGFAFARHDSLEFSFARFPHAAHGDPERHENPPHVEQGRLTAHVQPVEAELLPPRSV